MIPKPHCSFFFHKQPVVLKPSKRAIKMREISIGVLPEACVPYNSICVSLI